MLLSGATGFVGRHLAKHLAATGIAVGCVVRGSSDANDLADIATVLRHHGETEELRRLVGGFEPDCVVHLASHFVAEHRTEDVAPLIGANLLLATQLADASAAAGVAHFVNTGTIWQHYRDAAYNPVCLYAATKQAFDDILRFYRERDGLRVVTLELSDTYGPDDRRRKLLPLLAELARTGKHLAMSPGGQRIGLVYIDDVVAAFVRAIGLVRGLAPGEEARYAVSADQSPTLRELVALFEAVAGARLDIGWGERPYREREVMEPWRGTPLPGWEAKIDLRAGISRLLEAADVRG